MTGKQGLAPSRPPPLSIMLLRAPLLALALATLLMALWAGLIRLGWALPIWQPALTALHGPLLIGGFLGTLISLERAVALAQRWAYAAPVLAASGALALSVGAPTGVGALLITGASAVLLVILVQIWRLHPALYTVVIGLGAGVWLVGNGLWLAGRPTGLAAPWWLLFLVLTIAGERLELSRLLRLPQRAYLLFAGAVALLGSGLVLSLVDFTWGVRLVGLGEVSLAGWLLRYDIAGRRLKAGGQARYMAVCLLSGYGWLVIGGGLGMIYGGLTAGPYYDAMLHSVLLGFVFAMIFAHALIIFPAIAQVSIVYTARFYSHLLLLQVGLILRITSDLLLWQPGRQWGGLLNGLAILLLLANLARSRGQT